MIEAKHYVADLKYYHTDFPLTLGEITAEVDETGVVKEVKDDDDLEVMIVDEEALDNLEKYGLIYGRPSRKTLMDLDPEDCYCLFDLEKLNALMKEDKAVVTYDQECDEYELSFNE